MKYRLMIFMLTGLGIAGECVSAGLQSAPVRGDLIDVPRLQGTFEAALGAAVDVPSDAANWLLQPQLHFERTTFGLNATLSVITVDQATGRVVAHRQFSQTQVFGSESRDRLALDLLLKAANDVRKQYQAQYRVSSPMGTEPDQGW